jgi:YqxM protein
VIPIRYTRTKKYKPPFKKWKLLYQLVAIWYATTITSSFIDGTGAYFNDQDQVNGVITAGTWSIWDKSSLKFLDEQDREIEACSPAEISVRIKNTGSTMEGPTEYSVYYATKGNPKKGNRIVQGEIQPIIKGKISTLKATVSEPGNYKFKALQRPGHGNKEDIRHELWSETITITCNQDSTDDKDKGGGKAKPEPPKKEEKQEMTSPEEANKDQSKEENKEEPSPPVEEKQEPEQPAAPAEPEPETKSEEKAEVKAASEPQPDVQPVKKKDPEESAEEPSSTSDNNSLE